MVELRQSKDTASNERLGLMMIGASLAAIAVIVAVMFEHHRETRETRIRAQGVGLVRLLAGMPLSQLAPDSARAGPLQTVHYGQERGEFAYVVVADTRGRTLAEVTSPGTIVPPVAGGSVATHLTERSLETTDGQPIIEFAAPIRADGELAAEVRLGYFRPGYGLSSQQLSFLGLLALPVFLLTPLFYFLMRREIRPLNEANTEIGNLLKEGVFHKVEIRPSGDMADFMERFKAFVELARSRVDELETDQTRLLTSAKLLSYKKSRIERVLQALPESVLVLDEAGVTSFANDKIESLLGVATERVIGHRPFEWCDNPLVLDFLSRCEGRSAGGYVTDSVEYCPDTAPEKTVSVSAYPLFSPNDSSASLGTLVVFRDVTLEVLARRSRAEFVAHLAHELKTPLNVLAMYSESLQSETGDDPAFRVEAINVIHDEVERLAGLINNLLNLTRIESGSLEVDRQRVKLGDLLEDAFESVSRSGRGAEVEFRFEVDRDLGSMSVDKDLLRIAINNLLTNAIKYNRPGGSVTLAADDLDEVVRIRVRDTGIGIDDDERAKIFDKFYRSQSDEVRERSGHGLGLSLARDIVELHNGSLTVTSTPGEGSEFVIELWKDAESVRQAV